MSLIQRLRDRKIVQWAVAYLAGAWLLLQVLGFLADPFGWPAVVLRVATVVFSAGFLAVLVLAWYHGERGGQRVTSIELLMLAGILIVAATGVALVSGERAADAQVKAADAELPTNSVAVLPFENMSADPEQEYFSSGITEEILNALARVPGLRVPARTSSFQFKGQQVDARDVGRKLNVAYVLEGSVRKGSDQVRIAVQLINAADGYHLWSDTYDRDPKDVLAVQEEIARAVAAALQVRLGADPTTPLVRASTENVAAYELYLKGRFLWTHGTRENFYRAIQLFEQALALDPNYATAYAGLGDVYIDLGDFEKRTENAARARAALRKALELDPNHGQAVGTEAYVLHTYDRDYAAAERAYLRSLELNPQNAVAVQDYARYLSHMGRHEEAIAFGHKAVSLDPLAPPIGRALAIIYMRAGRTEEALRHYRAAVDLNPGMGNIRSNMAAALRFTGAKEQAIAEYRTALANGHERALLGLAAALADVGQTAEARKLLKQGEQEAGELFAFDIALVYDALGELDNAFRWLDRAVELRTNEVAGLRTEWRLSPRLKADPRYNDLLRKAGLAS